MILNNLLYKIKDSNPEQRTFLVEFIRDNVIYHAHFPERPITPGVCIIQIAVELLSDLLGTPFDLISVHNAKFIAVIDPTETQSVNYTFKKIAFDEGTSTYKISAEVTNDGNIYTKLSLIAKNK
jgi:3-hydroxyacyl-[acyl-carrier-protein] dehydratase